jgi:hypothetical protein
MVVVTWFFEEQGLQSAKKAELDAASVDGPGFALDPLSGAGF